MGVRAIIGENKSKNGAVSEFIVLLSQYADFANVFDKACADELPDRTQHDLAIEIENNEFLFFGPIYDHSRLELEALREYINEMLAKKFIRFFKSLSRAPVLFTKKNNGGLRMCVDFCGLNAIIKKINTQSLWSRPY